MKDNFPYIALVLGVFFYIVLYIGGSQNEAGDTSLPLLTLLVISEFSFFITAIGAYLSVKKAIFNRVNVLVIIVGLSCMLLAVKFLLAGIHFWPL